MRENVLEMVIIVICVAEVYASVSCRVAGG